MGFSYVGTGKKRVPSTSPSKQKDRHQNPNPVPTIRRELCDLVVGDILRQINNQNLKAGKKEKKKGQRATGRKTNGSSKTDAVEKWGERA